MRFYTTDGCTYFGMDRATVTRLRTAIGLTTTFTDQTTYDSLVAARQH